MSFIKSVIKVGFGNIICLIFGLASQVIVAWAFGAGATMDAFLTASVIPMYIQAVLIAGLSFVLIPEFIKQTQNNNEETAWSIVGTTLLISFVILAILTLFGILFSKTLISIIAPGLSIEKAALSATMLQIMMLSVPFAGIGSITIGVQNSRGSFFIPSIAPALGSLINILVVLLGSEKLGPLALAFGSMASLVVQGLVTTYPVVKHGWKKLIRINDPLIINLGKLASPLILFGIFTRITPVFERFFASGLPDGQLSFLGYGSKVSTIVVSIIGTSIATVIFPEMAKSYYAGGIPALRESINRGFKLGLFVGIPTIFILSSNRLQTVQVLFERGQFTHLDSLMTSAILPIVLLGSLLLIIGNIVSRIYYTLGDTTQVPASASITSLLYVILMYTMAKFSTFSYVTLAFGQTGQWLILEIWLIFQLHRKKIINFGRIGSFTFKVIVASILGSLISLSLGSFINSSLFMKLVIPISAGLFGYMFIMIFIDSHLKTQILSGFRMILNKKADMFNE